MDECLIRLECVKLAAMLLPRGVTEVIAAATALEGYVAGKAESPSEGDPETASKRKPGRPRKIFEGTPFA
jgi:hypothetical protein